MKNIYVVGPSKEYANFINDANLVDNLKDANIIIFTGGEDVDPSLYKRNRSINTFSNIKRDLAEKEVFQQIRPDQLVIGICRGLNCGSR